MAAFLLLRWKAALLLCAKPGHLCVRSCILKEDIMPFEPGWLGRVDFATVRFRAMMLRNGHSSCGVLGWERNGGFRAVKPGSSRFKRRATYSRTPDKMTSRSKICDRAPSPPSAEGGLGSDYSPGAGITAAPRNATGVTCRCPATRLPQTMIATLISRQTAPMLKSCIGTFIT